MLGLARKSLLRLGGIHVHGNHLHMSTLQVSVKFALISLNNSYLWQLLAIEFHHP